MTQPSRPLNLFLDAQGASLLEKFKNRDFSAIDPRSCEAAPKCKALKETGDVKVTDGSSISGTAYEGLETGLNSTSKTSNQKRKRSTGSKAEEVQQASTRIPLIIDPEKEQPSVRLGTVSATLKSYEPCFDNEKLESFYRKLEHEYSFRKPGFYGEQEWYWPFASSLSRYWPFASSL